MNKNGRFPTLYKCFLLLLMFQLVFTSCVPSTEVSKPDNSPITIQITALSSGPSSFVTIQAATVAPKYEGVTVTPNLTLADISLNSEPVIFIGNTESSGQRCGHGDIVATDGHILRATPKILKDQSNFLEKLPEGSRVDIIDCRLWTDEDDVSWLAVRTDKNKLGWMFLQADKFNVTVYPVVGPVPDSLTGLPTGTKVAYVPPSECKSGPVSNQAIATSIGVDLMPVVGDLKGIGEAATGCDMVTGERLGNWRWLGLLGLIGLSEIALLRHADEAADAARLADNARMAEHLAGSLSYGDEATMAILRNADNAVDFRNALRQAGNVTDAGADSVRYGSNVGELTDEGVQALAKLDQPCSFSPDTPIMTPKGLTPIALVVPGQVVLAYEETGKTRGFYRVSEVFHHQDPTVLRLTIGGETIETTPEHPFYVGGVWVAAGDLELHDWISSADGEAAQVSRIVTSPTTQLMYNLTVSGAHTFYVGQGAWLVHNACGRILRGNLGTPEWSRNGEIEWQAHHIIPGEYEGHVFFDRIPTSSWNIDGADNGIALPRLDEDAYQLGLPAHRGYHSGYSSQVRSELDALENAAAREGWSDARCLQELYALIARLKQGILSTSGRLP